MWSTPQMRQQHIIDSKERGKLLNGSCNWLCKCCNVKGMLAENLREGWNEAWRTHICIISSCHTLNSVFPYMHPEFYDRYSSLQHFKIASPYVLLFSCQTLHGLGIITPHGADHWLWGKVAACVGKTRIHTEYCCVTLAMQSITPTAYIRPSQSFLTMVRLLSGGRSRGCNLKVAFLNFADLNIALRRGWRGWGGGGGIYNCSYCLTLLPITRDGIMLFLYLTLIWQIADMQEMPI